MSKAKIYEKEGETRVRQFPAYIRLANKILTRSEGRVSVFVSIEAICQFYWSTDRASLANQPDVYLNFPQFLNDVVTWITDRRGKQTDRSGNAMSAVRTSTSIFPGAGVYTTPELWHMAGLAPNLTEAER
ncbi:hypothetical protein R3P38DRAFT_2794644 [Favolaschia claudopus]|uniref:Uncharacterized protein n=1 Tax=Favolaschia claudopus TaxID=2862362 RepID=A0AAW0A8K2_9AGAR